MSEKSELLRIATAAEQSVRPLPGAQDTLTRIHDEATNLDAHLQSIRNQAHGLATTAGDIQANTPTSETDPLHDQLSALGRTVTTLVAQIAEAAATASGTYDTYTRTANTVANELLPGVADVRDGIVEAQSTNGKISRAATQTATTAGPAYFQTQQVDSEVTRHVPDQPQITTRSTEGREAAQQMMSGINGVEAINRSTETSLGAARLEASSISGGAHELMQAVTTARTVTGLASSTLRNMQTLAADFAAKLEQIQSNIGDMPSVRLRVAEALSQIATSMTTTETHVAAAQDAAGGQHMQADLAKAQAQVARQDFLDVASQLRAYADTLGR